jgi:hypothetical protein
MRASSSCWDFDVLYPSHLVVLAEQLEQLVFLWQFLLSVERSCA